MSCNLSSINLSEYVKDPFTKFATVNYSELVSDIKIIVREMDRIIDENLHNHPLKEQQEQIAKYRNLGIGIMGLHDMFIKLNIKYGSLESIKLAENIMRLIFRNSVFTSYDLAKELGTFPGYSDKVFESSIMKEAFSSDELEKMKKFGLRNCSLLSIAPTGSISTMLGVSGGLEPLFMKKFQRKTVSLNKEEKVYDVYAKIVKEYLDSVPNSSIDDDILVTAYDIDSYDRIKLQAALQKYIDTAISSTINLKKDTSQEYVEKLYLAGWKAGLKGLTIFRENSRPAIMGESIKVEEEKQSFKFDSIAPVSRKTLGTTHGATFCKKCACGTLYITCNKDNKGNLVEVFTHTSKGGICQANMNAVTRLISLNLRSGVKVDEIIDQIRGINCPACSTCKARKINIDGLSCSDIISRVITEAIKDNVKIPQKEQISVPDTKPSINANHDNKNVCPECGEPLVATSGCVSCMSCGWSRCN